MPWRAQICSPNNKWALSRVAKILKAVLEMGYQELRRLQNDILIVPLHRTRRTLGPKGGPVPNLWELSWSQTRKFLKQRNDLVNAAIRWGRTKELTERKSRLTAQILQTAPKPELVRTELQTQDEMWLRSLPKKQTASTQSKQSFRPYRKTTRCPLCDGSINEFARHLTREHQIRSKVHGRHLYFKMGNKAWV